MRYTPAIIVVFCAIGFLFSCNNKPGSGGSNGVLIDSSEILVNPVLTSAEQAALTPQQVLDILKTGNREFVEDELTIRNNSARVRNAAQGQFPKAAILSCLDSRVPVEDVFHRGIGDIFVGRVAGNVINEDQLGSLEFACKVSGAKLILVLGHEACGAVKAAIDDVKLGNITSLLSKIRPAVDSLAAFDGEKKSSNPDFVHAVCEKNVRLSIQQIRQRSPILNEMEQQQQILIVGGVYNLQTGVVTFLE